MPSLKHLIQLGVRACSVMSDSTPQTVACQAPLSMGFSWQEYWSGLPFPPPGNLPDPGIEAASPALAGRFFTTASPGDPTSHTQKHDICKQLTE